MIVVMNINKSK